MRSEGGGVDFTTNESHKVVIQGVWLRLIACADGRRHLLIADGVRGGGPVRRWPEDQRTEDGHGHPAHATVGSDSFFFILIVLFRQGGGEKD
jgi:hypothetical protein